MRLRGWARWGLRGRRESLPQRSARKCCKLWVARRPLATYRLMAPPTPPPFSVPQTINIPNPRVEAEVGVAQGNSSRPGRRQTGVDWAHLDASTHALVLRLRAHHPSTTQTGLRKCSCQLTKRASCSSPSAGALLQRQEHQAAVSDSLQLCLLSACQSFGVVHLPSPRLAPARASTALPRMRSLCAAASQPTHPSRMCTSQQSGDLDAVC